jgi:hypothetical protein
LQSPPLIFIGGIGDISFHLLFVVALIDRPWVNGRAAVIEKSAEPTAIQLKLYPVILDYEGRNSGGVAFVDSDPVAFQAIGIIN